MGWYARVGWRSRVGRRGVEVHLESVQWKCNDLVAGDERHLLVGPPAEGWTSPDPSSGTSGLLVPSSPTSPAGLLLHGLQGSPGGGVYLDGVGARG